MFTLPARPPCTKRRLSARWKRGTRPHPRQTMQFLAYDITFRRFVNRFGEKKGATCSLLLCAKELISSDALIFLRRNGGEAMKYECLKLEERRIIEEMYAKGAKPGEIAERVGKCQATIYRELERGKTGETDSRFRQGYSAAVAEARVNRSYRNRGRRKAAQ